MNNVAQETAAISVHTKRFIVTLGAFAVLLVAGCERQRRAPTIKSGGSSSLAVTIDDLRLNGLRDQTTFTDGTSACSAAVFFEQAAPVDGVTVQHDGITRIFVDGKAIAVESQSLVFVLNNGTLFTVPCELPKESSAETESLIAEALRADADPQLRAIVERCGR
ncbi:MAG: hypothetical protein AAFX06_26040 [Planctomycetota bacterium]